MSVTEKSKDGKSKMIASCGFLENELCEYSKEEGVNVKLARRRKAQRTTGCITCPEWYEVRREIPEAFRKLEQKARTSKKEWKWQTVMLSILSVKANGTGAT